MLMKVRVPKASENHVGKPNIRITIPVATPVNRAFIGNAIARSSGRKNSALTARLLGLSFMVRSF